MTFEFTGEQYDALEKILKKQGKSVESRCMDIIRNEIRKGAHITHGLLIVRREISEEEYYAGLLKSSRR